MPSLSQRQTVARPLRLTSSTATRLCRGQCPQILLAVPWLISIAACAPSAPDQSVVLLFGERGLADGAFVYPRAIATERNGSVFVVDKTGRVQRFSADGAFETGWRMPEFAKGKPVGLTVHPDGRLFAADTHYHRVAVFDRDGSLLATFGREGSGPGEFQLPTDVAVDAKGNIYVSEYYGNDRVTKWSPKLEFAGVVASGEIAGTPLRRPAGIDIDDEQTLWIADACNHRVIRMTLDGEVLTVFGGFGSEPGRVRYPYDLCVTPEQTILVCEYEGNRLQWFSKDGRSLKTWGRPGRGRGELFAPWGATVGPRGRVYIVDSLNDRVQVMQP